MEKIVGFVAMKKRTGKVVQCIKDSKSESVHGQTVETLFLYDDMADKIIDSSIGKEITVIWGCGSSGKAYVADVSVK